MNTSNNTSHDSNDSSRNDAKRQQFTNKQRMDMYAFCVLELEMHSNKVSIKKQQQAIQKVLNEQQKGQLLRGQQQQNLSQQQQQPPMQQPDQNGEPFQEEQMQPQQQLPTTINEASDSNGNISNNNCNQGGGGIEGKTLLQLQQEVAMTRKCYSDYQKTQVLTSSMLRDVQKRFSRYYPDSAIPSRSTIKHVFEKCVTHGTVENIKTPRKAVKIPQGDEIEYLLIHEPQLSLRQMAQKLNVSTGTVSRRCKALGLVPESVTIKHQQLAVARRQKQIKLETQQSRSTSNFSASAKATINAHSNTNGTEAKTETNAS